VFLQDIVPSVKSSYNRSVLKLKLLGLLIVAAICYGGYYVYKHNVNVDNNSITITNPITDRQNTFNKQLYSLTDSKSIWVVVNKQRALNPIDYAPSLTVPTIPLRLASASDEMHVSTQMAPALERLVAAGKSAGVNLMLASGYRSYSLQVLVYNSEVKNYGQAKADQESARPGHSEHQTGLAADLEPASRQCEIDQCFGSTPEGKWLAANAYKYGFIIRYPQGKQNITGYEYEPWHVRYVGTALSMEMHKEGINTLEEFFGLPSAPTY
jgi:zinc D-Ala-D-Ala carboxypeptidase